jgi:cyclohexyl-isocyanide hydratase
VWLALSTTERLSNSSVSKGPSQNTSRLSAQGVAGLLKERRATTHWAYADLLPLVGATHEKARVVKDGNVITGGGVTAGIDFGLSVIAEIAGETMARRIQLGIEYDPAPPFDSGHPDKAPALKSELMSARYNDFRAMYRTRIEQGVPG